MMLAANSMAVFAQEGTPAPEQTADPKEEAVDAAPAEGAAEGTTESEAHELADFPTSNSILDPAFLRIFFSFYYSLTRTRL